MAITRLPSEPSWHDPQQLACASSFVHGGGGQLGPRLRAKGCRSAPRLWRPGERLYPASVSRLRCRARAPLQPRRAAAFGVFSAAGGFSETFGLFDCCTRVRGADCARAAALDGYPISRPRFARAGSTFLRTNGEQARRPPRRVHDTAHHLVERVLPDVPIRQYVLSPPSEMVGLLAAREEAVSALGRVFVESIFAGIQSRAGDKLHCGCVVFVQRFTLRGGRRRSRRLSEVRAPSPSEARSGDGVPRRCPYTRIYMCSRSTAVRRVRGRDAHFCRGHGADPRGASRDRGPRRGPFRPVVEAERFPGRGEPRRAGAGRVVDHSGERPV